MKSNIPATFCFKLLAAASAQGQGGRNLDEFRAELPDGTVEEVKARELRQQIFARAEDAGVQPRDAAKLFREELGKLFFTQGHPLQVALAGLSPKQIFSFASRAGFYVTGDDHQARLLAGNIMVITLDVARSGVTPRYGADFAAERYRALSPQLTAAKSKTAPGDIDAILGMRGLDTIVNAYRGWASAARLLDDERPAVRPTSDAREVPVMQRPDAPRPVVAEKPILPTISLAGEKMASDSFEEAVVSSSDEDDSDELIGALQKELEAGA